MHNFNFGDDVPTSISELFLELEVCQAYPKFRYASQGYFSLIKEKLPELLPTRLAHTTSYSGAYERRANSYDKRTTNIQVPSCLLQYFERGAKKITTSSTPGAWPQWVVTTLSCALGDAAVVKHIILPFLGNYVPLLRKHIYMTMQQPPWYGPIRTLTTSQYFPENGLISIKKPLRHEALQLALSVFGVPPDQEGLPLIKRISRIVDGEPSKSESANHWLVIDKLRTGQKPELEIYTKTYVSPQTWEEDCRQRIKSAQRRVPKTIYLLIELSGYAQTHWKDAKLHISWICGEETE